MWLFVFLCVSLVTTFVLNCLGYLLDLEGCILYKRYELLVLKLSSQYFLRSFIG